MKFILLTLIALGMLSGCATAPPQVVMTAPAVVQRPYLRDIVPASSLSCLREPSHDKVLTVRQAAVFIVNLKKAGADCRQKLGIVRDMIQREE
ncbi:hypothetical protein [Silvimonas sp.]|uniref:hypothetical protein n=1 Tax=Silvimonas sp. TaxID=2650811 RepID=UPI002847DF25|nr:hypothetical protein [Silvimonas sp.]MDR3427806.1 hypothetical protein [Silvimonas sp.]